MLKENKEYRTKLEITEINELEREIASGLFNQINHMLKDEGSLAPSAILALASSALKSQKFYENIAPKSISSKESDEGFQKIMKMLDQVEAFKRDTPGFKFK